MAFIECLNIFFRLQDKNSFKELKDAYTSFTIQNTPINGATECGRIFTKVLNPLVCKYKNVELKEDICPKILFAALDNGIEQIYRWSVTPKKDMSDERKEDSFVQQVKRVAKELGIRG